MITSGNSRIHAGNNGLDLLEARGDTELTREPRKSQKNAKKTVSTVGIVSDGLNRYNTIQKRTYVWNLCSEGSEQRSKVQEGLQGREKKGMRTTVTFYSEVLYTLWVRR